MARVRASVPLILASTSPRRRDLLALAGIPHRRQAARVDEEALIARWSRGERTLAHFRHLAAALALAKAQAVARRQRRPALVLGADTLVVLAGRLLGKPLNTGEARAMLRALSGRRHWVITGIALIEGPAGSARAEAVTTQVTFRTLTRAQVDWYAGSGEPMDKAGGYGIQGRGGRWFPPSPGITGTWWVCPWGGCSNGWRPGAWRPGRLGKGSRIAVKFVWDQWLSHFSADIAIDLGTANTPVLVKGRGIRLREPSYVAIDVEKNKVVAVGHEAKMMAGRTPPYLTVVRPIRDGVIANFEIAEEMMRYLLSRVNGQGLLRPRVIVGVPSDVTPVERRAVSEAAMKAGARVAYLIEQPLAAAIGAGLPVLLPKGSMVLDIGGGTSEAAVIALGGIVTSTSIRVAGDEMDEAIITHMRRAHNLLIGDRTAEEIKIEAAAALPQATPRTVQVRGRDLSTGLPATRAISGNDLVDPLKDIVGAIADAVKSTLEVTPPELSADIMESGIVLAGGGALLPGLDEYLTKATGVQCVVAQDAIYAVVRGAERLFMDPKLMHAIFEHGR